MTPINGIKALMSDYARPNRYFVDFGIPTGLKAELDTIRELKDIQLNCSAAGFPSVALGTSEERTMGPIRKMPNDVIYSDVTMTFYNNTAHREKKYFDIWVDSVFDKTTSDFNYYADYTAPITVVQYNNSGLITHGVRMFEAYPTNISEIALAYDSGDQIETFSVTFSYRRWEHIEVGLLTNFLQSVVPAIASEAGIFDSLNKGKNRITSNVSDALGKIKF